MSYKTILAILQTENDTKRVLDCAMPLTRQFDGHLIGLHSEQVPMAYAAPAAFPDAALFVTGSEINEERSAEIRKIFDERTEAEGISGEWRGMESLTGDAALSGFDSARTSDIVIAQQENPDAPTGAAADVERLLFEAGRPVLLVPYAMPVDATFPKVLIAWNGTRQACRAVFDAMPFITRAEQTEVLTLGARDNARQSAATAGAELAASLARHGANVTTYNQPKAGIGGAELIVNRISETGADLLVMGAFSQSRLKTFFFGGVTSGVLKSMTCAALMSH